MPMDDFTEGEANKEPEEYGVPRLRNVVLNLMALNWRVRPTWYSMALEHQMELAVETEYEQQVEAILRSVGVPKEVYRGR